MTFSLENWQAQTRRNLAYFGQWLKRCQTQDAPLVAYGALTSLTVWPVVEAALAGGQLAPAVSALLGTASGVGANLLATQIEGWRQRAEPPQLGEIEAWLRRNIAANTALRDTLDAILQELAAIPQAQAALTAAERDWFTQTLRAELAQLGNLPRFAAVIIAAGDNAVVASQASNIYAGQNNTYYIGATPDHAHLKTNYLNRLYDHCRRLSMEGIDPQAATDSGGELTLDGVYTALLTYQSEPDWPDDRRSPEKQTRLSALDQLNRHKYLVLRGDPGSGKSVFVNYVAMCLAGELLPPPPPTGYLNVQALTAPLPDDKGQDQAKRQPWNQPGLLPIRIILRDFVTSPHFPQTEAESGAEALWRFIAADLGDLTAFAPNLKALVSRQPALLLLDGLDEVPDAGERRQRLKAVILDFKACYPQARLLVTSRIYAYQQEQQWQLPEFAVATLAPFSRGQIIRFVERWYAQTAILGRRPPNDARGRAEVLKREILRNPRLVELAQSPLLLTLIASLHDWRSGSLPEEREKLYEEAVELLLENWEKRKVKRDSQGKFEALLEPSLSEYLHVTKKAMRNYLEQLAFEAHRDQDGAQSQQTADIPQKKLIDGLLGLSTRDDLKPRLLAHYLSRRAGLLPERRAQIHAFPHRTFQEYLAACYLNRDCYPDKVAELARTEPDRWREVTLLAGLRAAENTESPLWELADALCQTNPPAGELAQEHLADLWGAQLAGQGLVEAGTVTIPPQQKRYGERLRRVKAWLVYLLARAALPATERAIAGDTLARLGDPRPEVTTVDGLEFCYVPAGPFVMGGGDEDDLAYNDEKPQREFNIESGYWLARYPVTVAQWTQFVAESDHQPKDPNSRRDPLNRPVRYVTWYEAVNFCEWLTARWQGEGRLPQNWQVRLPSEAEWEKAARGGLHIPATPVIKTVGAALPRPGQSPAPTVKPIPPVPLPVG